LRGPVPGIDPWLQPAAHALVQAGEELSAAEGLTTEQLWARPGGAASVGFHLRHIAGSIDRLLTYARAGKLGPRQLEVLAAEGQPGSPPASAATLVSEARGAIEGALGALRGTSTATLLEPRTVGRQGMPTTVLGLLFHVGEHTQRHAAQVITTAKVVRGG
jgi:DinB superfamily